MSEKIICATQSPNKLNGTIVTSKRTISYCFVDDYCCCNNYGVEELRPIQEFVGKTITDMDLVELETVAVSTDEKDECGGRGKFTIVCDQEVWSLTMWNYHNGYYTMNFDVKINGEPHWNLAF